VRSSKRLPKVAIPCSPVGLWSVSERLSKRSVSPPIRLVRSSISSEKRKLRPLLVWPIAFRCRALCYRDQPSSKPTPSDRIDQHLLVQYVIISTAGRLPSASTKQDMFSFRPFAVGSIIAAWTCFGTLNLNGDWAWRLPCVSRPTSSANNRAPAH
jgi:hypothetical protein